MVSALVHVCADVCAMVLLSMNGVEEPASLSMNGAEKPVSLSTNGAEKPVLLSINGVEEPLRKAAKLSGSGLRLFLESNVVSTQVLNVSLQLGTVPTLLRQNQTDIRSDGTGNASCRPKHTQFFYFIIMGQYKQTCAVLEQIPSDSSTERQ